MVVGGDEGLGARSLGLGPRSLLASPAITSVLCSPPYSTPPLGYRGGYYLTSNIGLDVSELVSSC